MPIVADQIDIVIGVDTHKHTHGTAPGLVDFLTCPTVSYLVSC